VHVHFDPATAPLSGYSNRGYYPVAPVDELIDLGMTRVLTRYLRG